MKQDESESKNTRPFSHYIGAQLQEAPEGACKGETCPKPHCPVCGECDQVQWVPCVECHGYGTIECICEGVGGEYVCGYGCDELAAVSV